MPKQESNLEVGKGKKDLKRSRRFIGGAVAALLVGLFTKDAKWAIGTYFFIVVVPIWVRALVEEFKNPNSF